MAFDPLAKGIQKVCPRCGALFVCTHNQYCQCIGIHLNENARAYLRTHYPDQCLCRDCLIYFSQASDL